MINQRSLFFNIDWIIIFIYVALCVIGWFNIHAAVYDPQNPSIVDLDTNYGKQLLFIVVALILGAVILLLDNKFFNAFSPIFYGVTLILLVVIVLTSSDPSTALQTSLALFVIAALGGFYMFFLDLKGKMSPTWLAFIHAILAVGGFLFLLFTIL